MGKFYFNSYRVRISALKGFFLLFFGLFISTQINGQTLFYLESFESDGEGTRYNTSHFFDSTGSFFKRGITSDFVGRPYSPTGESGDYYWAVCSGNSSKTGGNSNAPADGLCTLTTRAVDISNYTNIIASYRLSAEDAVVYGPRRFGNISAIYLDVEYQVNAGAWTNMTKCVNANKNVFTKLYFTDPPSNVANSGTDTQILPAFSNFRDTVVGTGDSLKLRFIFKTTQAGKMIALDHIKIKGDPVVALPSNRVRLLFSYCGWSTNNTNANIWAIDEAGSADSVEFEYSGGDIVTPVLVSNGGFSSNLDINGGLNYGNDYDVRVRGYYSGVAGAWSDSWFSSCGVSVGSALPEMATSCGSSVSIFQALSAEQMGGATDYRFRIDGSTVYTTGGDRFFTLDDAGITSNGTYSVEAAAFIGGSWSSYGPACSYTASNGAPTIRVSKYQCGRTISNLNKSLWTDDVAGATEYEWEFSDGVPLTIESSGTNNFIQLSDVTGIDYDGNDLDVRVRVTVGGSTGSFGSTCTVTLANSIPTTNILWACGGSVTPTYSMCAGVVGLASEYLFRITGAGDTSFSRTSNCFNFEQLTTLSPGAYSVTVRAVVGTDTSAVGSTCNVTLTGPGAGASTPENMVIYKPTGTEWSRTSIYPNPTTGLFHVVFENREMEYFVEVLDINGKGLMSRVANNSVDLDLSGYPSGNYIVRILSESEVPRVYRVQKN